jgi:hypothetical protein
MKTKRAKGFRSANLEPFFEPDRIQFFIEMVFVGIEMLGKSLSRLLENLGSLFDGHTVHLEIRR